MTFSGFNHKMPLFVDKILYQILSFRKPDENRFACLLAELEQRVNNFATLTTYEQADGHLASVIYDRVWTFSERQAALKELTYDGLVNFIPSFLSRIFIETLVYGNALPVEAQRYHDLILRYASELAGRRPPVAAIPCLSREIVLPYGKLAAVYCLRHLNSINPPYWVVPGKLEYTAIRIHKQTLARVST
ncbi:unnamed protein product [Dibothriocephalus latus]|uniref:Peptidase M16 middle/third domain-containing protein n=1 Tax=Dibothriocephalus latus TaxID=60516 RepID=A0A3P7LTX7_DIBLA|nr:unnamed protein product [Dibothriocephalus latus]